MYTIKLKRQVNTENRSLFREKKKKSLLRAEAIAGSISLQEYFKYNWLTVEDWATTSLKGKKSLPRGPTLGWGGHSAWVNLKLPESIKEIKLIMNNLTKQKTIGPNSFRSEFCQTLKEKMTPIFYKNLPENRRMNTF